MKGYLAITTSIVLTLVVILVALALGTRVFLARFDTENFEAKKLSYFLSQSCLETALLNLAVGSYSGNETIDIGSEQCLVLPIESSSSNIIIKSQASINEKTTNLELVVDNYNLETISIEEVQSF
ncbi:MAG: hypothetical protein V3T98_02130 [Candidatus Paceibacterota bacterium]